MDVMMIFGAQFLLSLLVFALLAKWHIAPWLAEKPANEAISLLLFPHAMRHIGLAFLVPGIVGSDLPRYFANGAAYGDLASGLLALFAIVALRREWTTAMVLVGVASFVGTADLVHALSQTSVVPHLGASWFIPTFVVPVLLVTQVMVVLRLFQWAHERATCRTAVAS